MTFPITDWEMFLILLNSMETIVLLLNGSLYARHCYPQFPNWESNKDKFRISDAEFQDFPVTVWKILIFIKPELKNALLENRRLIFILPLLFNMTHPFTIFLGFTILLLASSCRYRNLPAAQRANHYGIMMAAEGKDSEAITAYMIAAKYTDIPDSNRSVYLENAGISWMALGHADSAVYCFERAAVFSPLKSYQWLICKAYAQKALEHTDSAAGLLLNAYAADSNKLAVNNMLGAIFTNSRFSSLYDPSRALRYNIQAFHLKTDIDTRFMLARNYYMIGKYQIALSYYRKIHEEDPFNTAYLVTLILMEEEMANQDRAAVLLDELKQKDSVQYDKVSHEVVIPGVHHLVWGE